MFVLLLILHLLVCIGLIGVVLLQSGKGGGLAGGAFGGSAQTVFGGRGATDFITRATMVLGVAFFATSLALALMTSGGPRSTRSLIQEEAKKTGTLPPPATLPSAGPPGAASGTPGAPSAPAPAPGGQPPSGGQPSGAPGQPPANPAPPGGTRPPGSPP